MVWPSENGVRVQWTAMGEGCVDLKTIFAEWARQCRTHPFKSKLFLDSRRNSLTFRASFGLLIQRFGLMTFHAFCFFHAKAGSSSPSPPPAGVDRKKAQQDYQLAELERSLEFCRKELGLGRKSS